MKKVCDALRLLSIFSFLTPTPIKIYEFYIKLLSVHDHIASVRNKVENGIFDHLTLYDFRIPMEI